LRHLNTHKPVPETIPNLNQIIYGRTGFEICSGYKQTIKNHINLIKTDYRKSKYKEITNTKISYGFTYDHLYEILKRIYRNQENAFKVNTGFGFVLFNTVDNIFKYYYVSNNQLLFQNAISISCEKDLQKFIAKIINLDLATNYYLKKPSSGWVLAGLPNVEIHITYLPHSPIGALWNYPIIYRNDAPSSV